MRRSNLNAIKKEVVISDLRFVTTCRIVMAMVSVIMEFVNAMKGFTELTVLYKQQDFNLKKVS